VNAAIICLLAVAASLSGYRLWHAGIHDSEYLANPTFWASAELPRIPAFHYGHGPYGTYVLAVSGDCSGCIGQLDFYKRVVAAARATAKGTKIVTVYPRNDRRVYDLLKQGSLDLMDTASADHVGPTPAVYFVDARGAVRGVWRGVLLRNDQEHILQGF
jgi:hypothetical protein